MPRFNKRTSPILQPVSSLNDTTPLTVTNAEEEMEKFRKLESMIISPVGNVIAPSALSKAFTPKTLPKKKPVSPSPKKGKKPVPLHMEEEGEEEEEVEEEESNHDNDLSSEEEVSSDEPVSPHLPLTLPQAKSPANSEQRFNSIIQSFSWNDKSDLGGAAQYTSAMVRVRQIINKLPDRTLFISTFHARIQELAENPAIAEIFTTRGFTSEKRGEVLSHVVARGEMFRLAVISDPQFLLYLLEGEYLNFLPALIS